MTDYTPVFTKKRGIYYVVANGVSKAFSSLTTALRYIAELCRKDDN